MTWCSACWTPADAEVLALDTSAAVAFLLRSHDFHAVVRRHVADRTTVLTTHSLAETYSVLTRLPGDARLTAADAARLIDVSFGTPLVVPDAEASRLPDVLAPLGIGAAPSTTPWSRWPVGRQAVPLLTRDTRAWGTYAALGADVEIVGG